MGILGYFTHFFGNQSMQWEKGTNLLLVDDLFFLNSFMKQPWKNGVVLSFRKM